MTGRVVLVETSEALPGLLSHAAWTAIEQADQLWARDPQHHPFRVHLELADIELEALQPARLDPTRIQLGAPGSPEDRRLARALVDHAVAHGSATMLLGPDDDGFVPVVSGEAGPRGVEIEIVFLAAQPRGTELLRLVEVERRLRDPDGGCPWDLEQDHRSLTQYLVEETYEVVDAIQHGTDHDILEELGDLLLQVVFHAQIATDRGAFGIDEVARGIADKLVNRHPHVFGDADADTAADVQASWDRIKADEKGRTTPFDGIPDALPALMLAAKFLRRAGRAGTPPPDLNATELQARLADGMADVATGSEVMGDLLLSTVETAVSLGIDPEQALRDAAHRYRARVVAADRGAEEPAASANGDD